jgi:hypothetical protein
VQRNTNALYGFVPASVRAPFRLSSAKLAENGCSLPDFTFEFLLGGEAGFARKLLDFAPAVEMDVPVWHEGLELVDEAVPVSVEGREIGDDEETALRDDPGNLGEACAYIGEMVEGVS